MTSPTTNRVADLLISLGWRSDCDAQWANLDMAIGNGKLVSALFSAEQQLRDVLSAQKEGAQS